jgi:hypothetical protein
MTGCDQARVAISARADGEAVGSGLEQHLVDCDSCRSFEQTVRRLRRELRIAEVGVGVDVSGAVLVALAAGTAKPASRSEGGAPARQPAAGADHRLDARARRHRPGLPSGERAGPWRWRTAGATAALVLAVGAMAFGAGRASQPVVVIETGRADQAARSAIDSSTGASVASSDLAVVWNRDRLDPAVIERLAGRVPAMTVVRRATVGLTASWDERGEPVDRPDDGWSIPLDVVAVDPASYGQLLGGEPLSSLGDGEVLLGATSAGLRDLGPGSRLAFGDVELTVVGVVDDGTVGAAEAAVTTATGDRLGVVTDRYAVVATGEPAEALGHWLEAGVDTPVRVRASGETAHLRNADAVLPQVQVKELFGEFATRPRGDGFEVDPQWFADSIVTADLPLVGSVTCHREVMPALQQIMAELEEDGFAAVITPERFQGCWNARNIRATGDLSRHSWGVAVDLTAGGPDPGSVAERLSRVFGAYGFTWGGGWLAPDDAHFEYLEPATDR